MSKKPAEAFTVQDLETGDWVAVAFHANYYARMKDSTLDRLLDELKAALQLRRDIQRGTRHGVEFLKRELAKTRPVYVAQDDDIEPELLFPGDREEISLDPDEPEPMFIGAEDDGVLNAGDGLDVSDRADASVDFLELLEEFRVLVAQAIDDLSAGGAFDTDRPVGYSHLGYRRSDGPVAGGDHPAQVEDVPGQGEYDCEGACCE